MSNKIPNCLQVEELDKQEHIAIKNLSKGEASEYEQKLALSVIVKKFAREGDLLYVPSNPDETAFLNGRAYVGTRIKKYITLPVRENTNEK